MIRKILLLISLVVIVLWFAGAHFIKGRLISAITELSSDNVKISYQEIAVSGFPLAWEVEFLSPKVTVVD